MILKRFYHDRLAAASYLVGCEATGEALVVDPTRDLEQYLQAARAERVRITHVTETHIHADFVSGTRELAALTNAQALLSAEGGDGWQYAYAEGEGAILLREGDSFRVGEVRIDVLHTPGHTPEHLSLMITDRAAANAPMGVFTGDFIFVGDIGRPDLLEKTANLRGSMEEGARQLFGSLQRFKELPEYLQLWPGHGAGSACGKALGAVPQSTLGYEKRFSPPFSYQTEEEFVRAVLEGQPSAPKYFAEMKRINREGPLPLGEFKTAGPLPDARLAEVLGDDGAVVLDLRPAARYGAGHLPGALSIPLNRSFTTWAGWLLPYDRELYLIAAEPQVNEAAKELAMIGLDRVGGYFDPQAVAAWEGSGRQLETVREISAAEAAERMRRGELAVLDVRNPSEWEEGHLPGVENIPLGELPDRLGEVTPGDKPLLVHCKAGGRGAIAASLLQHHGVKNVMNLRGGFDAWTARSAR
ncbi:MAG: rhodanese-like domain-containing protein [Longimicrobiaceae bacterium]